LDGVTYAYVEGSDSAMWRKVFSTSTLSSLAMDDSGAAMPVEVFNSIINA
jgi:hypothetical protein